jgi:hypothetical protein
LLVVAAVSDFERSLMLLGAAAVASAIVAHTSSEQPQIPTYISDAAW